MSEERSMEVNIRNMDDLDNQHPDANMSKKLTAEEITTAKIFEGCKHPELIDEYIRGAKEGYAQSRLQAIAEEVEEEITDQKEWLSDLDPRDQGIIDGMKNVQDIIQQHLD